MENQNQTYVQNERADVEEKNQQSQSIYSADNEKAEVMGDPSEAGDETLPETDEVGTADVDSLLEEMNDKDTNSGPDGEDTGEGQFTSLSTDPDDDDPDDDEDDELDGDDFDLDEDDSLPEEPDKDDLDLDDDDDDLIDTDPGYDENDEFLNSTQHS
ncbi:hypothetical protein [Pedobacter sp. L105]|uniref:hypothetical protein n=1 Tax=Pedobacter sp. L105 TaxID=1641871 RepID=UPI00131AE655|nr:hypothetical protein [Pedobacter sp. L105]